MGLEPDWDRLLPREPYRFRMGLRPGNAVQFFAATGEHEALTAERVRWMKLAATEHCLLEPSGYPLLEEAFELARAWGGVAADSGDPDAGLSEPLTNLAHCRSLGTQWEPDFLLLRAASDSVFRLVGAAVCFPSGWSPREKLGRTVAEIHGIVPTLNPTLGRQIEAFLGRLDPGSSWERDNWGLSRGAELNRHPYRNLPCLDETTPLEEVFLRIEHQIFFRLSRTLGLLFGIRLSLHPLAELMANPEATAGLQRALTSMPEEIAVYKGLAAIRHRLAERL